MTGVSVLRGAGRALALALVLALAMTADAARKRSPARDEEEGAADGGGGGGGDDEGGSAEDYRGKDLRRMAIEADGRGDFNAAVKYFRLHVEQEPEDGFGWNNLGVATMRRGRSFMMRRLRKKGHNDFVRSAVAFRRALEIDMNNEMAADNLRGVLHALEANFRERPSEDDLDLLDSVGFAYDDWKPDESTMGVPGRDDEEVVSQNAMKKNPPKGGPPMGAGGPNKGGKPRSPSEDEEGGAGFDGFRANDGGAGASEEGMFTDSASEDDGAPMKMDDFRAHIQRALDASLEEGETASADVSALGGFSSAAASSSSSSSATSSTSTKQLGPVQTMAMIRKARAFLHEGRVKEAAEMLCFENLARVSITPEERTRGVLTPDHKTHAKTLLELCGLAVVENAFDVADIERIRAAHETSFAPKLAEVQKLSFDEGEFFATPTDAKRATGRYEFSNPIAAPWTEPRVVQNPQLMAVVEAMLGPRVEIDTFSTVTSVPGAPDQHWHRDAGFLYDELRMPLPAHGIVAFIPLRNVTTAHGPTQFIPASHLPCMMNESPRARPVATMENFLLDLCDAALAQRLLAPTANVGSVVFFDFRVFHRGLGNRHATETRPLMYITYFREWFSDKVNFQSKQTRAFDDLSPATRKLFTRLDNKQYVAQLEAKLRELGGDPATLESKYEYDVYTFGHRKSVNMA